MSSSEWLLPERKWVLDKSHNLDGYIETDKFIYAYSDKYKTKETIMYRIDKETGDVVNCNEIK